MRRLLPTPADTVDLLEAYAYPDDGTWVRANMVASADGSAVADGHSAGLSDAGDKLVFGVLRGLCDVVLVGAGTARAEGYRGFRPRPSYVERRERVGQRAVAVLAVVSGRLDLDPASELFTGAERTLVVTHARADQSRRESLSQVADVVVAGDEAVDIGAAVQELATRGLRRILCEGGPRLLGDVSVAGRLDELCLTTSPQLVAGTGPRVVEAPALDVPRELELAHLLEEDGSLFARYLVSRA